MYKKVTQIVALTFALLVAIAGGYSQDGQPIDEYEGPVVSDSLELTNGNAGFPSEDIEESSVEEKQHIDESDVFDEEEEIDASSNSIISFNILYYLLQKFKFKNYFN